MLAEHFESNSVQERERWIALLSFDLDCAGMFRKINLPYFSF